MNGAGEGHTWHYSALIHSREENDCRKWQLSSGNPIITEEVNCPTTEEERSNGGRGDPQKKGTEIRRNKSAINFIQKKEIAETVADAKQKQTETNYALVDFNLFMYSFTPIFFLSTNEDVAIPAVSSSFFRSLA